MIAAVLCAVLYTAVLLFLLAGGFLSSLAAMDWLVLAGQTAFAALAGVALYRGMLRGWVRGRNHPASLRLLAAMAALELWFAALSANFWDAAKNSLAWNGDPAAGAMALAAVFAAGAAFATVGYTSRRRIGA